MGKRRLKDRVREAGEAFEQARDSAVDAQLEAARPDEDLFFVDTEASQRPAPRTRAEKRRRFFDDRPSSTIMPSAHLVKAVQRVMKTLPAATTTSSTKPSAPQTTKATPYDIWNAPTTSSSTNTTKTAEEKANEYVDKQTLEARRRKPPTVARRHPNKAAVPLVAKPLSGQSYHPAAEEHQAALQTALEVEARREAHIAKLRAPLSVMSEETRALLLSDSDSEAEGEGPDDNDDGDDKPSAGAIAKRRGKLTKAERNKQRRRKQAEHAQRRAAEQKAVVKQTARARELAKQLAKAEARKQQEEALRREREGKGKGAGTVLKPPKDLPAPDKVVLPADKNPIKARSLPVPLSDELGGSLRLVRVKGSLASEALEGLQRRGEYEATGDRKRARAKQRVKYTERFRGE